MKKIFTLLTVPFFALFTTAVQAQVTENFNTDPTLQSCFIKDGFAYSSTDKNASISSLTTGVLAIPYIDIPDGATVSASYNVVTTNNFNGAKSSKIEIGTVDKSGNFNALTTLTVSSATPKLGTISGTVSKAGTYRVQVRVTENSTALTTFIDDIIAASTSKYHYAAGGCNSAPTANDDHYAPAKLEPVTYSPMSNDTDPEQGIDNLTIASVAQPAEGAVTIDAATNTVTFTPNSTFAGGPVTFSYTITDNGYSPLTSTATVTINYPEAAPKLLPVKLISFQGNMTKERIQLQWSVAENEIADRFEVEKSNDGKNFILATVVIGSNKSGNEVYQISQAAATAPVMYRLKMVDNNGYINYSKVVAFQPATAAPTGNLKVTTATTDRVMATVTATTSEEVQFAIYDLSGKRVQQQTMRLSSGQNTLTLSLNNGLKTGIYVAEVGSATQHQTAKFFIR